MVSEKQTGRAGGWNQDNTINLLVNIIKQTNPDLVVSGWKDISARMSSLGFKENTCQ
jgi:hypothetical protein